MDRTADLLRAVRIPLPVWNSSRGSYLQVTNPEPSWWGAALCSLIFFFIGVSLFSYPGLQNDEALAASPLFRLTTAMDHISFFGHDVPTMLMAYLGALKTWLYSIVFRLFAPSYISIRMPALMIGTATVWILFLSVEKIHSRRAAWITTLLLATDPMFVLTTTFDWGPVALQHLLTICGIFLLLRFHTTSSPRDLAWAWFCFGLGFWDKALFAWLFGGLALATLLLYTRAVFRAISVRNVAIAAAAFCSGAAPLIAFNVTNNFRTFHSTSGFSTTGMNVKVAVLLSTWDGSSLFGYLAAMDGQNPRQASTALEHLSFGLHSLAGDRRHDGLWLASVAALLLLPFLWRTPAFRTGLFCLTAMGIAWAQMAVTRDAGGASHHVVLMWPLPMMLIGVVLAEFAQAWGKTGYAFATLACVCLVGSSVLVLNQYLYQLARNGSPGSWTDAIYPLAKGLPHEQATRIAVADWGMMIPLDVLDRGRLPLVWSYDVGNGGDIRLLKDPQVLWLGHTDGYELFPAANAKLMTFAKQQGYSKKPVALYYDRNGHAVFETFRLTATH